MVDFYSFEWDEDKNHANKLKHGIDFESAVYVFDDPYRIERFDTSAHNDLSEDRWQTIGKVGEILFVVYTERKNNIRLISARLATAAERRTYYGYGNEEINGWTKAD